MGIYFENKKKESRWESSQAILHKNMATGKKKDADPYETKNSFGSLKYLKKERKPGKDKEGFSLEAIESAGTPLHTEKEKHLNRSSMKKISRGDKKSLFASEVPLKNQALFYDLSGNKKSAAFLKCMKELLRRQGHRTLQEAFGFLEQESDRLELKYQMEQEKDAHLSLEQREPANLPFEQKETANLSLAEFDRKNKRIDTLNSRLSRKESKERQLCNELQTMLEQRSKKDRAANRPNDWRQEREKQETAKKKKKRAAVRRQQIQTANGETGSNAENQQHPEESEDNLKSYS